MTDNTGLPPRIGLARRLELGLRTIGQLLRATWNSPFWWLLPFCAVLAVLAVLFVLAATVPVMAPFVYALF